MSVEQWRAEWDGETALWWLQGPGHTAAVSTLPRVRPIPSAAARLVTAAEARLLDQLPVEKILTAIASAQVTDAGPHRGCIRWYQEETQPADTNAAFFTGLSLIALRQAHFDRLDRASQTLLTRILGHLLVWFERAVQHRAMHYPNKYLGDLVCCWLLMEINGVDDEEQRVQKAMLDAAHYWDHHHWGWGEHLSDTYAAICLDELSMLLLMSRHLPAEVRFAYQKLFDKLMTIEDEFDNGPRVPAIRSYAFTTSPSHRSYREGILPLGAPSVEELARPPQKPAGEDITRLSNRPPLGSLLHNRRWHETALARKPRGHDLRIPCFDGASAVARIEREIRLGSMTDFPIMPATDHATWGLSWQCFPVAMWRQQGDWGFLQWETRIGDRTRAHPAEEKHSAYLDNALSTHLTPPIVGRTYAVQQGGDLLVLRLMPMIASEWGQLHDRFRLIFGHADITDLPARPVANGLQWRQRLLEYPERIVSVQCLPLIAGVTGESFKRQTFDGHPAQDFDITLDRAKLAGLRCVPILWGISLNGPVNPPPMLTIVPDPADLPRQPEERILQLHWTWGKTRWDLAIDPLSADPLHEI